MYDDSGREERFNKNNLRRYGMHLEHIYAYNDANKALFTDTNGVFDEQRFTQVRNHLGMVLLLKDRQNISSGNAMYRDKRTTCAQSNLVWNELLVGHMPEVDNRHLPAYATVTEITPDSEGLFPLDKVELRQRELFSMIKHIWCDSVDDVDETVVAGSSAQRDVTAEV